MTKHDDPRLGRLLAGRDEPSIVEREALFSRIERDVVPPRRRFRLALASSGLLAAATAVVLAFFFVPRDPDELTPRGQGLALFAPRCLQGDAPGACRTGGRLVLDATAPKDRPFFAAFSRSPDGTIVWYTPPLGQTSTTLGAGAAVFAIDETHPPGPYTVYAVFSARALDRDALKRALGDALEGDGTVTVERRALVIEAAK